MNEVVPRSLPLLTRDPNNPQKQRRGKREWSRFGFLRKKYESVATVCKAASRTAQSVLLFFRNYSQRESLENQIYTRCSSDTKQLFSWENGCASSILFFRIISPPREPRAVIIPVQVRLNFKRQGFVVGLHRRLTNFTMTHSVPLGTLW